MNGKKAPDGKIIIYGGTYSNVMAAPAMVLLDTNIIGQFLTFLQQIHLHHY